MEFEAYLRMIVAMSIAMHHDCFAEFEKAAAQFLDDAQMMDIWVNAANPIPLDK